MVLMNRISERKRIYTAVLLYPKDGRLEVKSCEPSIRIQYWPYGMLGIALLLVVLTAVSIAVVFGPVFPSSSTPSFTHIMILATIFGAAISGPVLLMRLQTEVHISPENVTRTSGLGGRLSISKELHCDLDHILVVLGKETPSQAGVLAESQESSSRLEHIGDVVRVIFVFSGSARNSCVVALSSESLHAVLAAGLDHIVRVEYSEEPRDDSGRARLGPWIQRPFGCLE